MRFDKVVQTILEDSETKGALLTVRLPQTVKDDLQQVAIETKKSMARVVEVYFVGGKAMEKIKEKFPKLHDRLVAAQSPEEIQQILESLVSHQLSLESDTTSTDEEETEDTDTDTEEEDEETVEEGMLGGIKDKLVSFISKVGIPMLSKVLFVYNKYNK
jgi:hypothetical protein